MPTMLVAFTCRLPHAAGPFPFFSKKHAHRLLSVLFGSLVGFCLAGHAQAQLPNTTLYAGMHRIVAEVASAPTDRATGLMGRKTLPENHGMLFVFEKPGIQCFWMKNTFVPLSIAFMRDDGTITNIADMQPLSTDSHCSTEPVDLALEVNQGWFAKRNVKPGQAIRGLPGRR